MINVELGHVKDVAEFYKDIREGQETAHGDDYCQQHDAVKRYSADCDSYRELGTHQGGTLANALLLGFNYIEGVDIDMSRYRKFLKPHAEKYAEDNKIELKIVEANSAGIESMGRSVDMLLIDSLHKPYHMAQELGLHGISVNKYIIAHDTWSCPDLHSCLESYCIENPAWRIIERGVVNVGYTVLKKNA